MKRTAVVTLTILLLAACSQVPVQYTNDDIIHLSDNISSQRVTTFQEDGQGYIWMGTERGLNRYDGYEYRQYFSAETDSTSLPSDLITCLFNDSQDRLWVGTMQGVCLYLGNDRFCRIPSDSPQAMTAQIVETQEGRILVNTVGQLLEYDPQSESLKVVIERLNPENVFRSHLLVAPDGFLWCVSPGLVRQFNPRTLELANSIPVSTEDYASALSQDGQIWIAGDRGIIAINTADGVQVPLPADVASLKKANQLYRSGDRIFINTATEIYCFFQDKLIPGASFAFPYRIPEQDRARTTYLTVDRKGNLWTANNRNGVSFWIEDPSIYKADDRMFLHISGFPVVSGARDSKGNLWFLSDANILHVYNFDSGYTDRIDISEYHHYASQQIEQDLHIDARDHIWLRMDGTLLELTYIPGYDDHFGRLRLEQVHNEISGSAMAVGTTPDGSVWVGAGLDRLYKLEGNRFVQKARLEGLTLGFFRITPLSDGRLAIGSYASNPLLFNPENGDCEIIPVWDKPPQDFIYSFFQDHDHLWIGSRNRGIFNYALADHHISSFPDLPLRGATDILQDRNGNLWIASENGLYRLSRGGTLIGTYHQEDGLGGNQFIYQTALLLENSHLVFGGQHGLTVVNPNVYLPSTDRNLVFEDLFVGGKLVSPAPGTSLPSPLFARPTVTLNYRDRNFSFTFLDLNPGSRHDTRYFYKLEGFDKDWIDVGSARQAFFNNIPAGRYRLKVRIARSDMQNVEAEESLQVRILPAPWNSWWARLLYLLFAGTVVCLLVRTRKRILDERRAREQAAFEKEQEKRVNDMNMRFFANISHEFRTPLTMISGPVGLLEKDTAPGSRNRQLVETIKWNAARMLKLVNQLMDFNKLENDALRLHVSEQDLCTLVRQTLAMFRTTLDEKRIHLRLEGMDDPLPVTIDPDKIDKVLTNLLSNALKYTPVNGEIGVMLDTDGEWVTVEVSDNGISIPEDQLERIFERYYQVENHHNYGTGIGLYFARRLMGLHHGSIHAENLLEGVKFVVRFPARDIYKAEEHAEGPQMQQILFPINKEEEAILETHEQTLLVVDDDPGIVKYLKLLLSPHYNILYAYNADDARKLVLENRPDLILSDVAMPGTDGYELCRQLKADTETCHLPVILVTAKTTTDEQIAGLNTGADAYVTKPFDPDYLLALIRSQLENRARIRGIILHATSTAEIEKEESSALSEQDKKFMDRFYALMEEELANSELNINKLTELLFMSRTKLYYKVKGLTGETPNVFFKKYKLNRAAEMLKSGNYIIAEVSDLTGFSSQTVFARNFKAHFGMTPSEFKEQHLNNASR